MILVELQDGTAMAFEVASVSDEKGRVDSLLLQYLKWASEI